MNYKWAEVVRYREALIFGKLLNIDTSIKYVAVDCDGEVIGFSNKPVYSKYDSCWHDPDCAPIIHLGFMEVTDDVDLTKMVEEVK